MQSHGAYSMQRSAAAVEARLAPVLSPHLPHLHTTVGMRPLTLNLAASSSCWSWVAIGTTRSFGYVEQSLRAMWADGRVKEKGGVWRGCGTREGRAWGRAGYGEGVAQGRAGHGGGWRRKVMGGEGQETNTGKGKSIGHQT